MLRIKKILKWLLMQNPLHQLQKLDISALSSFDEFSNVMKLLSQVDNPEFVKQIEQKLKDNLVFREFQKERERENSPHLAEAGSRRLAELVAQKRLEKSKNQTQSHHLQHIQQMQILANHYGELLASGQFGVFLQTFEKNLQQAVQSGDLNAISTHSMAVASAYVKQGKPQPNENIAQQMQVLSKSAEGQPERVKKEVAKNAFVVNIAMSTPDLLQKAMVTDKNGNLTVPPQIKDKKQFEIASKLLQQRYDGKSPQAIEYQKALKKLNPEEWQSIYQKEKQMIEEGSIRWGMYLQNQQKDQALENRSHIRVKAADVNQQMDKLFSQILNSPYHQSEQEKIDVFIQQIDAIKAQRNNVREDNLLNTQFEQFSLYYANAQKQMEKLNIADFASFLISPEANKFGIARQLLNQEWLHKITEFEPAERNRLFVALGIEPIYRDVVLKAVNEIKDNPEIKQYLSDQVKRDYSNGKSNRFFAQKSGISFEQDGSIVQKLNRSQQKDFDELQVNNADWKRELNELVAVQRLELEKQQVVENNSRDAKDNLDENISYQVKIALFTTETTKTFQNNQKVENTGSQNYKSSI